VALSGAGAEVSPLLRPRIVDSGTAQKKYLFAKARRNWHARAAYSAGATKAALAPHRAILKQGCLRFNGNRSKAMTIQTRAIVAIAMLAGSFGFASAQTTTFTGPQGQYMGNARTFGNTTTYTGPQGQYMGNSNTIGNTTTFTGPQGQYQGSVTTFPGPRRPCVGFGC
jgi:hypothetical protein